MDSLLQRDAIEFLASPLSRFRPWRAPNGRSPQAEFMAAAANYRYRIFRGGNRSGKAQPLDEPVRTPAGWSTIGELCVGHEVVCGCGLPTAVAGVFRQGPLETFAVRLADGGSTRCSRDHLWKLVDKEGRSSVASLEQIMVEEDWRDGVLITPSPGSKTPRRVAYIEPVGVHESACIQVSCQCQTYLTKNSIVTHNTTVGVVDVLLMCLGWHPAVKKRPPVRGWVVALDWETVGQVIWPKFKQLIDPARCQIGWQRRTGVEIPESIHFPNGSELIFKSAEATREKFQGADLDFAWVDEEIDAGIIQEVEARLLDRAGYLSITLTPVARKAWVTDLERRVSGGKPLTKVVRASMRDAAAAGIINAEAVNAFLDSLPERQRVVREFGDFAATEGLVYPTYSEHTHVARPRGNVLVDGTGKILCPWPLPKEWPRYGGVDFGYVHPTAVPILCEDPQNERFYVERCYYGAQIRASRWATELQKCLPHLRAPLIGDHQAFERAEFNGSGVPVIPAKKDIVPGLECVERFLAPGADGLPKLMLIIDEASPPVHPVLGRYDAHWLSWELQNYRYPAPRPKDKLMNAVRDLPIKKDDDGLDALRYCCMFIERRGGSEAPRVEAPETLWTPVKEMLPAAPEAFRKRR